MIRLFYVSTATAPMSDADLRVLIEAATARNERVGLTGALAYNGVNFAQVLEGDEAAVAEVMASIHADERHSGVIVVNQRPVTKRHFNGWSMRLVQGLAFDELLAAMSSD